MRKIFIITSCLLLVFIGSFVLYQDKFNLDNISSHHAEHLIWKLPALPAQPPENLDAILDQPYSYLGKGHQSYAFISADQKYVLKFIKFTYLKPSKLLPWLPPAFDSYRQKLKKGQLTRFQRVLRGYQLAFDLDKENTGLLFVHFHKTNSLKKQLIVTDELHFKHKIDLDQTFFILQRKAVPTRVILDELLKKNALPAAKQHLRQIIDLYVSEYKKGLFDSDHNVMSNTGFSDGNAIRIDVGRLKLNEEMKNPPIFIEDLNKITCQRLKKWINKNYPRHYEELMDDIEKKVREILDNYP